MSMTFQELEQFRDSLAALKEDAPQIMEKLLAGEGVYCVGQARRIVTQEKKVDTGAYRLNFHWGDASRGARESAKESDGAKPRRRGKTYKIDVYNNLDYASYLEMGFRSHWVPGKYLSPAVLAHIKARAAAAGKPPPGDMPMGMYVGKKGGYVNGIWALKRAIRRTEATQNNRLRRKMEREILARLEGKQSDSK